MSKGLIYKVTSPSGRVYIGQTVQKLNARRWYHCRKACDTAHHQYDSKFYRAIRKYNESLKWEVIYGNVSVDKLDTLERKMIAKYNSYNKGYNGTTGGYGRAGSPLSIKSKRKLSHRYMGNGNPFYGRKHSEETKKKMSESSKGQAAWNKNISHTIVSRKKMSISQRKIAEDKGKLTWPTVREIRNKYATGQFSYSEMASEYGITKGNVGHIIRNRIWIEL